jgi:hypothetical protein
MSSIKLKGSTSGDVTITVPAVAGTNTVTIPAASGNLPLSNLDHVTNRPNAQPLIINGDMQITQRSTSTTGITGTGLDVQDRFSRVMGGAGTWTQSSDTDVPTGQGFTKSMKWDCTATASVVAGSLFTIRYIFEGQDLQLLKYGTSNAEKVTLAFWIKSPVTGTHIASLYQFDDNRQVSKAYTVSSADTWQKVVLDFPADTTGVIDNDNGAGMGIELCFRAGSNYTSGTLNTSWASYTAANQFVGQVDACASTANNIYLTGVQLEVGEYDATTIPPFQHESFGDNLTRCERYYRQSYSIGTKAGTATQLGSTMVYIPAVGNTLRYTLHHYGMRATPTFAEYNPETGTAGIGAYEGSGDTNSEAISTTFANEHSTLLYNTNMGFTGSFYWQYILSAEI